MLVDAGVAIDLTRRASAEPPARWTHRGDYAATQALGRKARATGVAVIRTPSARSAGGINVAVPDPATVAVALPHSSWAFAGIDDGLIATRERSTEALRFPAADVVNGQDA